MSKGLIFFCCACAILLFTIINLSVGPIVSGAVGNDWGTENCQYYKDLLDADSSTGDAKKYGSEWNYNECLRKKGMHDMEYTSFIFNMAIGFTCGLLGLLHLFDVKKEFVSKTGIIGLGCGIVGFIFSFVYVILNGLVYTTVPTSEPKRNSDGAYAERSGNSGNFKCLYNDNNPHAAFATISDLIQKQYNYDKDLNKDILSKGSNCIYDENAVTNIPEDPDHCSRNDIISGNPSCTYLYIYPTVEITNKDLSDRFLTTLLLSLLVCLANIGLAIFGFLLFRTPSEF